MSRLRDELFRTDQTTLAVGTEVYFEVAGRRRYGVIVQMGDEDCRPGGVLVYEGPEHEYPAWWNAKIVYPTGHAAKGRVTDRRLDQRLRRGSER